jgi:hypothetical protein
MGVFCACGVGTALLIAACQQPIELSDQIEKAVNEANAGEEPPAAPSDLQAEGINDSRIDLIWTDNSDNEDQFQVARKPANTDSWQTLQSNAEAESERFEDRSQGLEPDTLYDYRIRAVNPAGVSHWSNVASARTSSSVTQRPVQPSGLSVTAPNPDQINLQWEDNSDNEDGFEIGRKLGEADDYLVVASSEDLTENTVSFVDKPLTSNTAYYYAVRAVNEVGESEWWESGSAVLTPELETPTLQAPSIIPTCGGVGTDLVNDIYIGLTWSDNNGTGHEYDVYRDGQPIGSTTDTYYYDYDAADGVEYEYTVRAQDTGSTSGFDSQNRELGLPCFPPPQFP